MVLTPQTFCWCCQKRRANLAKLLLAAPHVSSGDMLYPVCLEFFVCWTEKQCQDFFFKNVMQQFMTHKKTITMYACFPHWFKIWKTTTAITDVFYKGKLRCLLMLAWLLSIIQRGNVFNAGGKVIALHFKETIRELLNAWADQCTFGNVFQLSSSGDPAIWFPLTMVIKLYSKLEARESEDTKKRTSK